MILHISSLGKEEKHLIEESSAVWYITGSCKRKFHICIDTNVHFKNIMMMIDLSLLLVDEELNKAYSDLVKLTHTL